MAKTIESCFSRAKAQANLELEIEFDSDIPLTVEPERTLESLKDAKGLIEQAKGRLQHSLWWFRVGQFPGGQLRVRSRSRKTGVFLQG